MPGRYVSINTREKLQRPVDEMTEIKQNAYVHSQIPKKDEFEKNYVKRKDILDAVTPPDTTEGEKDKLKKRVAQLTEALVNGSERYVPPMPNEVQMQKAPVGAVDQHMRWESFWKKHTIDANGNVVRVDKGARGAIWEWKDLRRVLYKGYEAEAPNCANIEMIRPTSSGVPLADTHLPVSYGFSPTAKVHYDEVFPDHEPTPVEKKVGRSEVEQLGKIVDALEKRATEKKKRKRDLSEYTGPRCKAIRRDGTPCNLPAVEGKDYCFSKFHRIQLEAKAKQEIEQEPAS